MDPIFFRKYADLITEAEQMDAPATGSARIMQFAQQRGINLKQHGQYLTFRLNDEEMDSPNWKLLQMISGHAPDLESQEGALAWAVMDKATGKLMEIVRAGYDLSEPQEVYSTQSWTQGEEAHNPARTPVGKAIMQGISTIQKYRIAANEAHHNYANTGVDDDSDAEQKSHQLETAMSAKYGA
jgi:hypothetical protein